MADEPQVIETPAPKEIIAPGYTFGTVTDQIATVVLTKKTPLFWFAGFGVGFALLLIFLWKAPVRRQSSALTSPPVETTPCEPAPPLPS